MTLQLGSNPQLATWVRKSAELLPEEWNLINADYTLRKQLYDLCQKQLRAAYQGGDRAALADVHEALSFIYELDFSATTLQRANCEMQPVMRDLAATLERGFLEHETQAVPEDKISGYPTQGTEYIRWLKQLISDHRCSRHPFYTSFLVDRAKPADLKYFLAQETNLDPRFDDILALMQVGIQGGAKMEIANNYFDEMGNGKHELVHSHIFKQTLDSIGIDDGYIRSNVLLDGRVSGNLSACLALSRRHYFKSIGYFGVTEYLAPRRSKFFAAAWRRNNLPEQGVVYHEMHIKIDAGHARGWFDNVIVPLIDQDPKIGREIALGSIIRLNSSERYLDAILRHLEGQNEMSPVVGHMERQNEVRPVA